MNKPDWKDAPEWADYLAQDYDGTWYWYENKPTPANDNRQWYDLTHNNIKPCKSTINNWKESLQKRPQ